MTRPARWSLAVAAVAALAVLVPAAADWLVTKDGSRVETQGPWEVRDRLVVFKRPDGTFASMRLADVDLEASERLTRELAEKARSAREGKERDEPRKRPVVARLTEKDLPPVGSERSSPEATPAPADGEDGGDGAGREQETAEPESLQIVTWRELGGAEREGIEFVGDVRNVTGNTAVGVTVAVTLYDEEGEEIANRDALLTSGALPPGQTAGFRASFPGVFHYVRVDFEASGQLMLSGEDAEEDGTDRS